VSLKIRSLTNGLSDGNEITVWFPQDRNDSITLLVAPPDPFEQHELHLVPLPAQCRNVLAADEGTESYQSIEVGYDCPKCHGPVVKFLATRPLSHYVAHCRCVAATWIPESHWSWFIDAAPSWIILWEFFLEKLDQAFDANQAPPLSEP